MRLNGRWKIALLNLGPRRQNVKSCKKLSISEAQSNVFIRLWTPTLYTVLKLVVLALLGDLSSVGVTRVVTELLRYQTSQWSVRPKIIGDVHFTPASCAFETRYNVMPEAATNGQRGLATCRMNECSDSIQKQRDGGTYGHGPLAETEKCHFIR